MDLMTGLTAANQALGLVKQLRDLERAAGDAVFRDQIVKLQEALFDARSSLLDAKEALQEKDAQIAELGKAIDELNSGELCPACRNGKLKKIAGKKPRSQGMARAGIQEWTMRCDNDGCAHEETKLHDPNRFLEK